MWMYAHTASLREREEDHHYTEVGEEIPPDRSSTRRKSDTLKNLLIIAETYHIVVNDVLKEAASVSPSHFSS